MNLYGKYKPLRNLLTCFNLTQSIEDLWIISNYIVNKGKLPFGWKPGIKNNVLFAHDLPLLLKEIILNASDVGEKRLGNFADFIKVINAIRKYQEYASAERVTQDNIWHEIHRISHQQFPAQIKITLAFMIRYIKVFGEQDVNNLLLLITGLGIKDFIFLGMAVSGQLLKECGINMESYCTEIELYTGITPEQVRGFLSIAGSTVNELREEIKKHAKYDEYWVYSWNPVESKPLIALDVQHPYRFYCPIPDQFLRRITQGIFYEFGQRLDANKFGKSFEKYIGEIIYLIFPVEKYTIASEAKYTVGKNVKHGTDWTITENNSLLYIECKTKRMTQKAKFSDEISNEDFKKDIGIMADAIVQLYANIDDARKHTLNVEQKKLPIFPLIIMLEDWLLFSPSTKKYIDDAVRNKLIEKNILESVMTESPYTIMSSREFEIVSNVIQEAGIFEFFSKKNNEKYANWMVEDFCYDCFLTLRTTNLQDFFMDDWKKILPSEVVFPHPVKNRVVSKNQKIFITSQC